MKRLSLIALLGLALAGCASTGMSGAQQDAGQGAQAEPLAEAASAQPGALATRFRRRAPPSNHIPMTDEAGSVVVQAVEFRPGVSSAAVEKLARRFGCTGSTGAGLVTEDGPLEIYRLRCDNGTTFIAQCELRQCRPMR
jgi:hypothetical protein